ncbi:MAG: glucose 1-dehydrogenase [Elusimicrobia bacterium]|nr:glucose 1-dehydrogenase [Elusimicrobiota bacterium]
MRLKNKIAIVTGGGTGIGRAIALRFAGEGALVVVSGRRPRPIKETAQLIEASGGRAKAVRADVTLTKDAKWLIKETLRSCGKIDILVNNAGILPSRLNVLDTPEKDWEATIRGNLSSAFLMCKHAMPELIRQRGNIINIASVAGLKGTPLRAAYGASKGGIIILTKGMALDFASYGVRVNAICPAYIETDINREYIRRLKAQGKFQALVARHPMGILGCPDDVAWAALYLASDEARWVTGVALAVDGGVSAGV